MQQVLDADELVLQALGLGVGGLEHAHDARRRVNLHDVVAELRRLAQRVGDLLLRSTSASTPSLLEDLPGEAVRVLQQRQQDVLDVPLGVAVRCAPVSWLACSTSCACSVNLSCLIMANTLLSVCCLLPSRLRRLDA